MQHLRENRGNNMTRISVIFSLLCVLCGITSSFAFVFEDCGSELGKFNELTISSCDMSEERCTFPREKDIHVSIKFTPNKDIPNVIAYAFGVVMDVAVPFPLENPEVCKNPDSGIKCPLKQDQEAEYKTTFAIEKIIPALSVDVIWEFRNDQDEKIICMKFPVKIV